MNDQLELSLQKIEAKADSVSLTIPETASLEQWADIGKKLYHAGQRMTWWLADWAAFGDREYGQLKEFCDLNGFSYQTISNLASVARGVESSRRRESLSFSHHVEVAALPAREQTKWLGATEKEKLSVVELRRRIRESTQVYGPEKTFGPQLDFIQVEKVFLDAKDILDRQKEFIASHPDESWKYASPFLKRAAEMWPDKVQLK
jgi:hypothetical protein